MFSFFYMQKAYTVSGLDVKEIAIYPLTIATAADGIEVVGICNPPALLNRLTV
jgi:hypothetical protein